MAFVFGVMAFFKASISMLNVSGSTSISTGVNFNRAITSTVAAKVKSTVITSSPMLTFSTFYRPFDDKKTKQ